MNISCIYIEKLLLSVFMGEVLVYSTTRSQNPSTSASLIYRQLSVFLMHNSTLVRAIFESVCHRAKGANSHPFIPLVHSSEELGDYTGIHSHVHFVPTWRRGLCTCGPN